MTVEPIPADVAAFLRDFADQTPPDELSIGTARWVGRLQAYAIYLLAEHNERLP